jgi:hypothetical protein
MAPPTGQAPWIWPIDVTDATIGLRTPAQNVVNWPPMFRPLPRPRQTAMLLGAAALFTLACGQGLFDRARAVDASQISDTGSSAGPDAGMEGVPDAGVEATPDVGAETARDAGQETAREAGMEGGPDTGTQTGPDVGGEEAGDGGIEETSLTVDRNGGDIYLDEAHLVIGVNTVTSATLVILRRIPSIPYTGAWGPVFEIEIPAAGLFKHDPKLTLQVQDAGIYHPSLALGSLDPSRTLADQQWVPITDSVLTPDQSSVTGPVVGFNANSILQFAAIIRCGGTAQCPSKQACNSGACQKCPTNSPCAP